MTYKSFLLPLFEYADVVWDNCTDKLSNELEHLHLDALRTIVGSVWGTSHEKLCVESGFTSLKIRRFRHKLILYFKIVNGSVPNYLIQLLPALVAQRNPYPLRNPLARDPQHCRTELYRCSFIPSTTNTWNNLPDSVKCSNSLSSFKRYLSRADIAVPPYYYVGNRDVQIVHCRLRLGMRID